VTRRHPDLFDVHQLSPCVNVIAEPGCRQVNDDIRGVVIDLFTEPRQYLEGGSDFCG